MSNGGPILNPLFPANSVLTALSPAPWPSEPDTPPGWAQGMLVTATVMAICDHVIRSLSFCGFQPTFAHFTPTNVPGSAREWISVDLGSRTTQTTADDTVGLRQAANTGPLVLIEMTPFASNSGGHHGLNITGSGAGWVAGYDEASGKWTVELVAGSGTDGTFPAALSAIMPGRQGVLGAMETALAAQVHGTEYAGLFWLLDPTEWFGTHKPPAGTDPFTAQIFDIADRIFPHAPGSSEETAPLPSQSNTDARTALLGRQFNDSMSIVAEFDANPIAKSYWKYSEKGLDQHLAELTATEDAMLRNLAEAAASVSWFDLVCLLLHCGLINPPRLLASSRLSAIPELFTDPPETTEPMSVEVFNTSVGSPGQQTLVFRIDDVIVATLIQNSRGDNGNGRKAPYILDNVGWEYLGIVGPGETHGIALTVGRAVRIETVEDGPIPCAFDIVWTQMPECIPRPVNAPLNLTRAAIKADMTTAQKAIFDKDYADVQTEDITLNDAQTLAHLNDMRPAVFEADLDPDLQAMGFNPESPPMLVHTPLGNGGVKFEWFNPKDEKTSQDMTGQGKAPPAEPLFTVILKPKNPKSGDFAYSFNIDYIEAGPKNPSNTPPPVPWMHLGLFMLLSMTTADRLPVICIVSFRLWFSGDVDMEVHNHITTRVSIVPELIRFDDPLDLPPAGDVLPIRAYDLPYLSRLPDDSTEYAANFYWRMADSDQNLLPPWDDTQIDGAFTARPIGVADEFQVGDLFPVIDIADWVGTTRLDTYGAYLINSHEVERWRLANPALANDVDTGALQIIEGKVTIQDPTWFWITLTVDVVLGFTPIGDAVDVFDFFYACYYHEDKWGRPVSTAEIVFMGGVALCPFVSSGMAKAGVLGAGATAGGTTWYFFSEDMSGGLPPVQSLGDAMPPMRVVGNNAEEVAALEAIAQRTSAFRDLSPRQQADLLEELKNIEGMSAMVLRLAETLGNGIGAGFLKLDDLLDEAGEFKFLELRLAYNFWAENTKLADKSVEAFLRSRKFTKGRLRRVLETFGGPKMIGKTLGRTVQAGSSQMRARWPRLAHLTFEGATKISPADLVTALRGPGRATALAADLEPEHAAFVLRYAERLDAFLARTGDADLDLALDAELAKIVGDKHRSVEEVITVMAHLMELAEDACHKAERTLDSIDDVQELRPILNELMQAGVTRSGHQNGAVFEFFGSAYRVANDAGIVAFKLQVRFDDDLLGPDLIEFLEDGYRIVQYKSLSDLAREVGKGAYQDNMFQFIKDMARLANNEEPWRLGADFVPDGAPNAFNGEYLSIIDFDQFRKAGQHGLEEMWRLAGDEVFVTLDEFPASMTPFIMAVGDQLDQAVDATGKTFRITKLDDYQELVERSGDDTLNELWRYVSGDQANDMETVLENMETLEDLKRFLQVPSNFRGRSIMRKFVKMALPKGQTVDAMELMAENGAQRVFDALGLQDGWMNPAKAAFREAQEAALRARGADDADIAEHGLQEFSVLVTVQALGREILDL
ncbi:hypothetical protein LGQ03_14605 [Loktanella sp. TSTF-M6]|uniref:Uncharacterized protein n=1 Tax=Loktanella gaetbuli TaxID=2881335 RepID=A0ABS8BXL9_9RHOB|nr:hypothetical protein [Loktanella gaetbuli]MCB5200477.1 hypothetical protein [Loktanella gaetbuli]